MKYFLLVILFYLPLAAQTRTTTVMTHFPGFPGTTTCVANEFGINDATNDLFVCGSDHQFHPLGSPTPSSTGVTASPTSFGFGTVQTSSNSQNQSITISNIGSTDSITITSAAFTGNADFQSPSVGACNGPLAAGASCAISVFFNPSTATAETASLVITTSLSTLTIPLTGTGTPATTFPLTVTGSDTGSGTVRSGDGKLNCVMNPPTAPSGQCSTSYPNGTSVILTATATSGSTFRSFNGSSCSISPCNLTISSPGATVIADFSENAPVNVASVAIAPQAIAFGTVQNGTASPVQNIAISNPNSSLNLTVNSVVLSNSHYTSSNIHICDGVLRPGATCVVPIVFTPTAAPAVSATATVNTNAPVDPLTPPVVTLTGSGTAAATFPLTVNASGTMTGSGTVTSNEATPLINCHLSSGLPPSGSCSNNYASGATPILTATPDNNQTFGGFSGGGCSVSPCTVTISAATVVTATFTAPIPTFVLTISGVGQGTGSISSDINDIITGTPISCTTTAGVLTGKCSGTFNQLTTAVLTETPSGSCVGGACTFSSWGGVNVCSTGSTCSVTMVSNTTVSASFAAPVAGAPLQLIQTIPGGTLGTGNIAGTFSSAQTSGNANIVYGLWTGTFTVSSITDTKGNTYTQSSCSPKVAGGLTVVLYYNANIATAAGGANTITIALSGTPGFGKIFAGEYSGLTSTPVDVCAGATGTSAVINSGNMTTTVAGDLLTAAANDQFSISSVSPSWTQQISATGWDMEDRQGVAIGTYNNAPIPSASGNWVDIAAAWKVGASGTPTTFTFNVVCGGNGSGTVAASGISLTCTNGVPSGTSSTSVALNSSQTLVATPQGGSSLISYSGAGCGTTPTCVTSAITTNTVVTATFSLAGQQQYFVNASTGSNSNSGLCAVAGTPSGCSGPWATIQKADSAIVLGASGTVVNVAAGNYAGPITTTKNGTASQRIVYQGAASYASHITTINWSMNGSFTDMVGFDGTSTGFNGFAVQILGNFDHILNNKLHDFDTSSCPALGIVGFTSQNPAQANPAHDSVVDGNIIRHGGTTSGGAGTCTGIHGIYLTDGRAKITNNIISGITGWGIQVNAYGSTANCPETPSATNCANPVISNNTIFNNGGGILITQNNNAGFLALFDYATIDNNFIFNNGCATCGTPAWGLNYFHVTGLHNVANNNGLYNNLPGDLAYHGAQCGTNASGSTPAQGLSLTGSDSSGNAGGCPATNSKTDSAGATASVVNFRVDSAGAPDGSYNPQNYVLKPTSNMVNGGSTSCAGSPAITPCVPSIDFNNVNRPSGPAYDIGAFEQ